MASLSPNAKQQFFDANGNPLAGGKVYTYAAGTTTPIVTYTDSTGATNNTNPIILDSRGEANIWLTPGTNYKFKLTDASEVQVWVVDNILGPPGAAAGTVTSVAIAAPALFTVSGSPVTTDGTLTLAYSGTALPVANGGTGLTTTPANGELLIGNGTGYTKATLTAGSNVTITNTSGGISIASTGGGSLPSPGAAFNVLTSNGSTWTSASLANTIVSLGSITGTNNLNFASGQIFKATLTGNVTFTVSGVSTGDSFSVLLTQDGTGSRTATWPAAFKFAGASSTLSTAAGTTDFVNAFYDGTYYYAVLSKGYA
jgi:hypothetical protein